MQRIIKHDQVRVEEARAGAPSTQAGQACAERPAVELIRENGRVHAIRLRCDCGRVSVIELHYGQDGSAQEALETTT